MTMDSRDGSLSLPAASRAGDVIGNEAFIGYLLIKKGIFFNKFFIDFLFCPADYSVNVVSREIFFSVLFPGNRNKVAFFHGFYHLGLPGRGLVNWCGFDFCTLHLL